MADKPLGKKSSNTSSRGSSSTAIWIVLAFSAIILVATGCSIWQRSSNTVEFVLVKGDESVLVLLRNEEKGMYRLQYNGSKPIELENLLVMLAPETLHVSVIKYATQLTLKE